MRGDWRSDCTRREYEERQVAGTITLSVRRGIGRASQIPNPDYLTADEGEE